MSAEPSPVDPGFPQLEIARDPELMREILQRHLRPLGKETYQVRECRISYVRHRQAVRLQYTLRLEEAATGRERTQLVSGVMYAGGQTRRIWKKLQRSELGRALLGASLAVVPFRWIREKLGRTGASRRILGASPAFAPFSYIPDLDMLVQVFPYDHRLPALPLLMRGPPPELEPLLLAQFGPGNWQAEAWDTEPVRYLAEMRATLRLTARARDASSGRVEERRFYAKVYHDEETGEQTYQALRALWDKASAGEAGFNVGRPIAYLSDLRTLIQEEVSGTSFREILRREDEVIPAARRVARALAGLHLDDRMVAPRRRLSWKKKEIRTVERAGELLQRACPHLSSEVKEIVGTVVAGLEEVPPAPTHGDLKLDHIILDDDRLVLLDLDKFGAADPILDVAHFLAPLANAPRHSPILHERRRAAARAFVEEYFAQAPEAWRARLPLHYASALLKIAEGAVRKQAPGWPDKIETLIEEAKNSLAGKAW